MTVENAHAFLDSLRDSGAKPELMQQIGTKFQPEHMKEALKARGINLKSASGGNTASWVGVGVGAAGAAAAGA